MDFFEAINNDAPGGRVMFTTPDKRFHYMANTEDMQGWSERRADANVYFSCALMRKPHFGRGGVADTIGITMLWLDLDIADDAHKAGNCPTELQARQILAAYPAAPSLIVNSGHGWHAYWLLDAPFMFSNTEDRNRAADLMRGWQAIAQIAGASIGCHVDSTHDLARVLRVPGTFNVKNGGHVPVTIIDDNCERYGMAELEQAAPKIPAAPKQSAPRANGVKLPPEPWPEEDDFETFLVELRAALAA